MIASVATHILVLVRAAGARQRLTEQYAAHVSIEAGYGSVTPTMPSTRMALVSGSIAVVSVAVALVVLKQRRKGGSIRLV